MRAQESACCDGRARNPDSPIHKGSTHLQWSQDFTADTGRPGIDFAGIHLWPDNWLEVCVLSNPSTGSTSLLTLVAAAIRITAHRMFLQALMIPIRWPKYHSAPPAGHAIVLHVVIKLLGTPSVTRP